MPIDGTMILMILFVDMMFIVPSIWKYMEILIQFSIQKICTYLGMSQDWESPQKVPMQTLMKQYETYS